MDANGTRFHLIDGEQDWELILTGRAGSTSVTGEQADATWSHDWHAVTLRPQIPIFPRGRRRLPLDPAARRGAACDRFGTWYWIGADRQSIYRAPAGSRRAVVYWQLTERPRTARRGEFFAVKPPAAPALCLSGLAVTSRHYLVVGAYLPGPNMAAQESRGSLLLFDLHAGGEPLRLDFPEAFEPFDLAAVPGDCAGNPGGLWVLDRRNGRLWGLDRLFRLLALSSSGAAPAATTPKPGSFGPASVPAADPPAAASIQLPANDPIALEVLPGGSLLVLDGLGPAGGSSQLLHYRPAPPPGTLLPPQVLPLPGLDRVAAPDLAAEDPSGAPPARPVRAYDMAYLPGAGSPEEGGYLAVVEQDGNQAIAYHLSLPQTAAEILQAKPLALYLPMHYFGERALAFGHLSGGEAGLFYDVAPDSTRDASVRWVRLHNLDQPRYARRAVLETPVFDSRQAGCTWHRLFLDACIPPESGLKVFTRAGDDFDLLALQAYRPEPDPYLRGRGAEIPFWESGLSRAEALGPAGTWETVFQAATGRFLQVRIELSGNGRSSPVITRLRAYFPRYSYLRSYLPAVYAGEPEAASFTERFLGNMEGFYTEVEDKIASAPVLFDPNGAPPEALDWLAAWVGLVFDPLWSQLGSNRALDRRRLLIRFAMRLYERRGTPDGIRFALALLLDPCLEQTLERMEQATVIPDLALGQELERLGLPYPARRDGEAVLETIFYYYLLRAPGRSRVRIVEGWETRPSLPGESNPAASSSSAMGVRDAAGAAHRFSVLIPEDLTDGYMAMVEKIVRMEKPAHTDFDLRRFWDYFLVGQARLGLDTVLGEAGRYLPILLGRDYLAEGYLEAAAPMDTQARAIADRDRPGEMIL